MQQKIIDIEIGEHQNGFGQSANAIVKDMVDKNTYDVDDDMSLNLLAPIGVGSKAPEYLPVFFMYDLDFFSRWNHCFFQFIVVS